MKKFLIVVVIFSMLLSMMSLCFAKDNSDEKFSELSEKQIEKLLLEKGVPVELQVGMSDSMKKDVINDDSIINLISVNEPKDKSMENVPLGTSVGKVDIKAYIFTISDYEGYPAFKLYSDFKWIVVIQSVQKDVL